MTPKRLANMAAGFAAVAFLAAGCGAAGTANQTHGSSGTVNPNATLTMATNADPNFNPWSPTGYLESEPITELIFSGLTKWGLDYQPIPDLATKWTVSSDGLTWTFDLRHDVKWQDGQPFTSDDVVYTFNDVVLNKKLGANGASNYADVEKVVAKGPYEVQFILKKPWASLPTYLAYYTKILPKHIFNGQDPWKLTSFNKEHPIGTGPYVLKTYLPGQYVELEKNPSYFGDQPKIPKIVFKIIPDTNTQIAQLLSGNLSLVTVPDPTLASKLEKSPNIQVNKVMTNIWYWIALNQSDPRFQDVRVRQALLYAIDRDAIIKGVLKGYGKIATGPIAPIQQHYYNGNVEQYTYNPDKAKELLKEAGYTPGPDGILQKDGKPFVITMPTGQYGVLTPASELVQQYWKNIGIQVQLDVMDWNSWIQKVVVHRDYQATLAWWSTPTDPDQYSYFASVNAGKGYNIPGYKNPELDDLLLKGRTALSDADRVKAYQDAQALMAKELPYLFLWYPETIMASQKNLKMPNASLIVAEDHIADWAITG
ncbi:ABC transporter substrate-binding protein [Alicyclobacillus macrosporangiidus]|uniref:ABC transporter substrate-binding protein n=1 Tax=Alicyclobacillus macrosporangiidus TaxID=392015 RepID=UPI000AA4C4A5|nr:ABC transporter substrate-binding protein [Alicyclobacillus macrosporangiidus]